MTIKPILFNTDMVLALLDGRKTVTRRIVKPQPQLEDRDFAPLLPVVPGKGGYKPHIRFADEYGTVAYEPYKPGNILYVRETWAENPHINGVYMYRAFTGVGMEPEKQDNAMRKMGLKWYPSVHMPKKAARIFLRVTGVRMERLQDITDDDIAAEGLEIGCYFDELWDSTIKPAVRAVYGWATNPWVWVIGFERCEKPEGWQT